MIIMGITKGPYNTIRTISTSSVKRKHPVLANEALFTLLIQNQIRKVTEETEMHTKDVAMSHDYYQIITLMIAYEHVNSSATQRHRQILVSIVSRNGLICHSSPSPLYPQMHWRQMPTVQLRVYY